MRPENIEIEPHSIDREGVTFKFYNFDQSYISKINKDIILNTSLPSGETHYNVIYVPSTVLGKKLRKSSCLYSEDGPIIDSSKVLSGTGDNSLTLAPPRIEVKSGIELDKRKFIYIGFLSRHYGHFVIESLSRIWFDLINNNQDYYLLYHGVNSFDKYPLIVNFIQALGIDSNRLVMFDRETKLSEVIIPAPSITIRGKVYEVHNKTVNTIAENLTKNLGKIHTTSQPLYLSRRLLSSEQRLIENESKLEEILIQKGVNVQHPQFLPLAEQIYLINRHQTIMGPSGSALHSLLFSLTTGKNFIAFTRDRLLDNVTQMLIDLLKRTNPSYIKCLNFSGSEAENEKIRPWKRNLCLDLDIAISALENLGIL